MEIFATRIRELRKEKNLRQEDVARACKTTNQTVARWELNQFEPDQATTAAIARYFDVTTDYLLGLENYDGTKIKK